jgi:hypothetical protein
MQYAENMRRPLDIDDELLLRESLQPKDFKLEYLNGVPLLPHRPNGPVVTAELVKRLLDEDE